VATNLNDLFLALGIASWKPVVSALFVSPLPLIAAVLIGAAQMYRRRALAWLLILGGCLGLWLSTTLAFGQSLDRLLLRPPPALDQAQIAALKGAPDAAIVVLGGGRKLVAPEYGGIATTTARSLDRLRYGIWLGRATGLPVAFSGGIGWRSKPGATEAEVAARVAADEFGFDLRWQETRSRDTRENAIESVALLHPLGIRRIVVVTHDSDMRRAVANFERAAAGKNIEIVAAPMDVATFEELRVADWLPSPAGYERVWSVLHEWVGILAGA
jgi:uncharacterized SAM-binding protein YcdF (DUF218 family)